MKDAIVLGAMLISFALLATVHLAIVVRLVSEKPRYRAILALVVPPLAPWWAYGLGWRISAWLWVGAVVGYGIARAAAMF